MLPLIVITSNLRGADYARAVWLFDGVSTRNAFQQDKYIDFSASDHRTCSMLILSSKFCMILVETNSQQSNDIWKFDVLINILFVLLFFRAFLL